MTEKYKKLTWIIENNGFKIDCNLDVFVSPANNKTVFMTIPGVDGSIDGYENKYKRITENMQNESGFAIARMANPYISSLYWDSNIREMLEYLLSNKKEITGSDDIEIHIMSHSAGAAVIAQIAWEYPEITRLLLVNTAFGLRPERILKGIESFSGQINFVFGSKDPSVGWTENLKEKYNVRVIDGADHNFSDEYLETFIGLPSIDTK
jgi:hypothetical protein